MATTHVTPDDDGATTSAPSGAPPGGPAAADLPAQAATDPTPTAGGPAPTYTDIQRSAEFAALRRRFRRFVFPLAGLFLVWYFLYVLLAAFAPGFMGTEVVGNINIGLLFGLGQFASTFAITMAYARWADRTFDPAAEALRVRFEAGLHAEAGQHA